MVKFSTKDDPGYKKILNSIEVLLEGLDEDLPTPSKQGVLKSPTHYKNLTTVIVKSEIGHRWTRRGKSYSPRLLVKLSVVISRPNLFTSSLHFMSPISLNDKLYIPASTRCLTVPLPLQPRSSSSWLGWVGRARHNLPLNIADA